MSSQGSRVAVAIMAGGLSQRMGATKADLKLGPQTLLEHIARASTEAGADPVIVVGRARPENWQLDNVVFITDMAPALGPIGGLQTALTWASDKALGGRTSIAAIACDMPLLSADAIRWLIGLEHLVAPGVSVVNDGRVEPLFSVYSTVCLAQVEARIRSGRRSLSGLIEDLGFAKVEAPGWIQPLLENVNTPDEWKRIGGT